MDVDDHGIEEAGHRLGHGPFMGVRPDGDVDSRPSGHFRGPGPGGVDDDLGAVFALIGLDAADTAAFDDEAGRRFSKMELRARPFGMRVKCVGRQERRSVAVIGRERAPDEVLLFQVRDDIEELFFIEPVDVEPELFLSD